MSSRCGVVHMPKTPCQAKSFKNCPGIERGVSELSLLEFHSGWADHGLDSDPVLRNGSIGREFRTGLVNIKSSYLGHRIYDN